MEQNEKNLKDYWFALKRRRAMLFTTLIVIGVAATVAALVWPAVYRSSATILIEQQEIPADLVRSTISSFADQRVQVISQRVMTRSNLNSIIEKYNLYPAKRQREALESVIETMRQDIQMKMISADVIDPRSGRPTAATIAFSLAFNSESPPLAQKVANELASLYLNENLKSRKQMATETAAFLTNEVGKYSTMITAAEKNLAAFKEKNYDRLPEMSQVNIQLVERTQQELSSVEREAASLRERKNYLEGEQAQLSPDSGIRLDNGEMMLPPKERMQGLQSRIAILSSVYLPEHPELKRLERELKALQETSDKHEPGAESVDVPPVVDQRTIRELEDRLTALRRKEATARERYSSRHPEVAKLEQEINQVLAELTLARKGQAGQGKVNTDANTRGKFSFSKSSNPAYVQVRVQLESTELQLRALEDKTATLNSKLQEYESRLAGASQVERDYRQMVRDYENAAGRYHELKAKQNDAQLAESLESERKGERFTLVEPPELPEKPIKPNRLSILMFGWIIALAASVGIVVLLDVLDETVHSRAHLMRWFNIAPLVTIPYIETPQEVATGQRQLWIVFTSGVLLTVTAAAAVHFLWLPLDVAFYTGMRRFGL